MLRVRARWRLLRMTVSECRALEWQQLLDTASECTIDIDTYILVAQLTF